jgi:glycosyltransferase involved in cell wall biosynthesis
VHRPTLSIVVPVYNERGRLPRFLDTVAGDAQTACRDAGLELEEIVVVDDGSTDGTQEVLLRRAGGDPAIKPVLTNTNRGKGAVVAAGVRQARGELTLVTDVDLSTPLDELPKLARAVANGAGLAIGSRALDRELVERSRYRHGMSHMYNLLVRALTGLPFRDTQCGFKLARTDVARALVEVQEIERYAFDVEALLRARAARVPVAEVPVVWRQDEDSRVTPLTTAVKMAADTALIAYRLRGRKPPLRTALRRPQADRPRRAWLLRGPGR